MQYLSCVDQSTSNCGGSFASTFFIYRGAADNVLAMGLSRYGVEKIYHREKYVNGSILSDKL